MEEIQNQIETLIDDIERDESLTKEDINIALNKLKEEIEDYNLRPEVEAEAEKIFKENDAFSRIDAYVKAYHEIIDD